jgi:hypothetical protein
MEQRGICERAVLRPCLEKGKLWISGREEGG